MKKKETFDSTFRLSLYLGTKCYGTNWYGTNWCYGTNCYGTKWEWRNIWADSKKRDVVTKKITA